jgi:pimeloyl-ACP methyl ester carboxylesterase
VPARQPKLYAFRPVCAAPSRECSVVCHAQESPTSNGRFIVAGGRSLYFEESGSGPPLILLHNFGSTARFWDPYVSALTSRFRVINVELPGHGRSDALDTTVVLRHERAAWSVLALMDSLHIDQASITGFSSGGITALYAASLAPARIRAVAVIGAQVHYSREVRDWIQRRGPDSANVEAMARLTELHGAARGMQVARQFWHFRQLYGDPALTPDRLERISARTLIIHGEDDFVPVAQAWEMHRHIAGAHLWIVPNAGHFPFGDSAAQQEFTLRLMEFLSGEWRR